MAYTDQATIESALQVTLPVGLSTALTLYIAAVTDFIERYCGNKPKTGILRRVFEAPNPNNDVTKKYDGNDGATLYVDDIFSLTSLVVFGTPMTEATDFYLYPANEVPKERIELIQPDSVGFIGQPNSRQVNRPSFIFPIGQQVVVVTGKFYYSSSVPQVVKLVTTQLVIALLKEAVGNKDLKEITSEGLGDYSVTYEKIKSVANGIGALAMLEPFVRQGTVGLMGIKRI